MIFTIFSCKNDLETLPSENAEQIFTKWQQVNPFADEISLRNFEHTMQVQWDEGFSNETTYFIPVLTKSIENLQDSFKMYRFVSYSSLDASPSFTIHYFVVPIHIAIPNIEVLFNNNWITSHPEIHCYHRAANYSKVNEPTGQRLNVKFKEVPGRNPPIYEGCTTTEVEWYWQYYENGVLIWEEYLFSTYETVCPPQGGGGGGADTIIPTNNPCDSATKIGNNSQFKSIVDTIRSKTSGNREYSYSFSTINSNEVIADRIIGDENKLEVGVLALTWVKYDGIMHNHFTKIGKSVSIFSVADLNVLITMYQKEQMRSPYSFSMTLASQNGRQYMLMIDNLQQFHDFANKFKSDPIMQVKLSLNIKHDEAGQDFSNSNEAGFLKYLSENKSGLKFFKKNNTNQSWEPFKYSGTQVVVAPCN